MDNKITKSRLKTFFTYDFLKVCAIALAVCIVFVLAFNFFTAKPTAGQSLNILYGDDITVSNEGAKTFIEPLDENAKYKYSYEILMLQDKYLNSAAGSSLSSLKTWHETGDDDLFICSDKTSGEDGDISLYEYYLSQAYAEDIKILVENALDYANAFYPNGELDEQAVEEHFNDKSVWDNRFKSKEKKLEGLKKEIERIKTIKTCATTLLEVFNAHPEVLKYDVFDWYGSEKKGHFAIRLNALTGGANEKIASNDFKGSNLEEVNGNMTFTGEVYLMIGRHGELNGDNHYESLVYLTTIIKKYSNFIG